MDEFFSIRYSWREFRRLDEVSTSEFHTYRVDDLNAAGGGMSGRVHLATDPGRRAGRRGPAAASRLAGLALNALLKCEELLKPSR